MRKLHKYEPKNNDEVLVVKNGVTYRVLDLGGSKIEIRVKTPKEILKDKIDRTLIHSQHIVSDTNTFAVSEVKKKIDEINDEERL